MTELALRADTPSSLSVAASDLVLWAEAGRAAYELAKSLVSTSFCPAGFRGKPYEATAAILSGMEVGLSPMAALRSFDDIQGTAAARAITLRAIVQSAGHELWTVESTASRCVVEGKRSNSEHVERSLWTIERAAKLKLTGKANWQNQPTAMLLARATSECARLVAADAILGIPYSSEEIEDSLSEPSTPMSRTAVEPVKRTARRAVTAAPQPPEPDLDDPPVTAPEPTTAEAPTVPPEPLSDTGEVITPAQLKKLHAAMTAAGITDRETGLSFIATEVGREVATSKDLTKAEASLVIDALAAEVDDGQDAEVEDPPVWPEPASVPS